ncbi:MAG: hypothetical protein ACK5LJ_14050 [Paracoccus sp. (in: a-proteobacteria)]
MQVEAQVSANDRHAARDGTVRHLVGRNSPGWTGLLEEGEDVRWQGWSRPKLRPSKDWMVSCLFGGIPVLVGAGFCLAGAGFDSWLAWIIGGLLVSLGLWLILWLTIWEHVEQRRVFYSLSNRRAFIGLSPLLGKRRLVSWPITPASGFRLIKGDPPSIRFYEGRLKSGRLPRHHAAFESIEDADEVYKLLQSLQGDAS